MAATSARPAVPKCSRDACGPCISRYSYHHVPPAIQGRAHTIISSTFGRSSSYYCHASGAPGLCPSVTLCEFVDALAMPAASIGPDTKQCGACRGKSKVMPGIRAGWRVNGGGSRAVQGDSSAKRA